MPLFNPDLVTDDQRDLVHCRHHHLETFRESPRAFFDYYIAKLSPPSEPSPAMRIGAACDALLLCGVEPLVIDDKLSKSTSKASKAKKLEMKVGNWLTESEYNKVMRMVDAARSTPEVADLLSKMHKAQDRVLWKCPFVGFPKRGSLDYHGDTLIIDLKTAAPFYMNPRRLGGTIHQRGYHRQIAHYQEGVEVATGHRKDCKLVFIGNDSPYDVLVVDVPQKAIDLGHRDNEKTCHELADAYAYNDWKQKQVTMTLELPGYAYQESDHEVDITRENL